ncbi:MAG: glycosyltransferase family 39 protein [Bacteroidia bacterium]
MIREKLLLGIEKSRKLILFIFFGLFFIIGLNIYTDYGLSWDEGMQWKDNGTVVYDYVFHKSEATTKALLEGNEKYHGPAFELTLVIIEKVLHLEDPRTVFLMRHLVNFLVFFISTIFFYFLCNFCFKNWKLSLLGSLFLILSPRIFADAFYNSKDLILLSFFIIGMYTVLIYYQKQTYKWAILNALICGFTIDIRILGIVLPLLTFGFVAIDVLFYLLNKKKPKTNFKSFFVYLVFLILFTILFWPVLWEAPIFHFMSAFTEMSNYQWTNKVLYLGEFIPSTKLPWHYLPVWIFITTPFFYSILFIIGLFCILRLFIKKPLDFIITQQKHLLAIACFFVPIIMVIILKSVVYDAWRHVFFIYPAFLLIALFGLKSLYELAKKWKVIFTLITAASLLQILYIMIKIHPYQYVYFNFLAGKNLAETKNNFELDYYGVSSKQALEYLLTNNASINLYAESTPSFLNINMFPPAQREKVRYSHLEHADYFIGQYRWHPQDYKFENEVFSVVVDSAKIISVFKLTDAEKLEVAIKGKVLLNYFTDFEKSLPDWEAKNIIKPESGAHSGEFVTSVNKKIEFGDVLSLTDLKVLLDKKDIVLKVSFWKYEPKESKTSLVVCIQSANGDVYYWDAINTNSNAAWEISKWINITETLKLPVVKSSSDIMKIYLLNRGGETVYMDDLNLEFIQKDKKQFVY